MRTVIKATKKLDSIRMGMDFPPTDAISFNEGFAKCIEEIESDIINFEDDWCRDPRGSWEIFKNKYIKS